MKFNVNKGPFLRDKRSTTKIMLELFAVLCVIWFTSIAFYASKYNLLAGVRVFGIGMVSLVVTLIVDVIVALIKRKRKISDILKFILKSYSYVTAIIFALCLPAGTSFYVVVLGAVMATVVGKYVFGGFGNNIFNPAIIGRIFVGLAFSDKLKTIQVVENNKIDLVSGATLTGSIDWKSGVSSFVGDNKINLLSTLFGEYQGAIGETFTALLIVAGIYLLIRGIINYRLVLSYLITAALCALGLGLLYKVDNVGEYLLTQLATGGLMFAAVFMITDPVTSPKSQDGKIIYASMAGFLTIFIRVFSSYPEGVMFSIALMNMVTPIIDLAIKGNTYEHLPIRITKLVSVPVLASLLVVGYGAIPFDEGKSDELPETSEGGNQIVDNSVTKISDSLYEVVKPGHHSDIKLRVRVDRFNNKISEIKVVNLEADELYSKWTDETNGYIGENLNIAYTVFDNFNCDSQYCVKTGDTGEYDLTSGASATSSGVIRALKAVIEKVKKETSISISKVSNNVYEVTKEAYDGALKIRFTISDQVIVSAVVVDVDPGEYYHSGIEAMPGYDKWFGAEINIPFSTIDLYTKNADGKYKDKPQSGGLEDIISEATYTPMAVIDAYKEVVDAVRGEVK